MPVPGSDGSVQVRNESPTRRFPGYVRTFISSDRNLTVKWAIPFLSIAAAFVLCGGLMWLWGANPFRVYGLMVQQSFGSVFAINQTFLEAIPLLLCGLGVAWAYRISVWNIGAEGQFTMGAIAATGMTIYFPHLPSVVMIPSMMVVSVLAGAGWACIAAVLKAYLQVNELITTLMLNYVAGLYMDYLVYGPWKDPKGFNFPGTAMFTPSEQLPTLFGTQVHIGAVIALVGVVLYAWTFAKTRWGYELRVLGSNPTAARYAGIPVVRQMVWVMFISGGLAGLAGMCEVSGVTHQLQHGLSPGYGYTAIIVAWLARLHPIGLLVSSVFFGGLLVGGYSVQTLGLPSSISLMLQGAILFFAVAGEYVQQYGRWSWRVSSQRGGVS